MAHFPDTRAFSGVLRPLRLEGDLFDLEVEGEVPAQLNGTFHRVHPDRQLPPRFQDDPFFNGDGMVSLFRFQNGRVDFKQRFARTDRFELERAAGHALFGAYRNPLTDDPAVKGRIRGTANANVIVHGGELYALAEDSPALLMDPLTLETKGYTDFDGKCRSQTFTAHPKIDPITGNMVAFSYASSGLLSRDCTFMEISPGGELLKEVWFETPYYCLLHDFGVTEDYAVFHVVPLVSSRERLEAGLPHFGFDTTLPVHLGVLPRDGQGSDMRWFKSSNLFCSHVMNAFNEGTRVYFDTPVAKNNMFPFFPDIHGATFAPEEATSFLTRWTVDMNDKGEDFRKAERLTDMAGEFPRIDDRYATQPHGYGWLLVTDHSMPFHGPDAQATGLLTNRIALLDFRTGRQDSWFCGPESLIQEPCFVPRTPTSPEGDGYLFAVVDNVVSNYSDLVILEALAVEEGPIARVKLPFRLRPGLHGNWADERKLSKS